MSATAANSDSVAPGDEDLVELLFGQLDGERLADAGGGARDEGGHRVCVYAVMVAPDVGEVGPRQTRCRGCVGDGEDS